METSPESGGPKEKSPLEVFHDTVAELKRKEETGEAKTAHLTSKGYEVEPKELVEDDFLMWRKITLYPNAGQLTRKEFLEYQNAADNSGIASRSQFAAYLSNLIMKIWQGLENGEERQ